jgi:hypothetical protein
LYTLLTRIDKSIEIPPRIVIHKYVGVRIIEQSLPSTYLSMGAYPVELTLICLQRIYNFWCSMLVLHQLPTVLLHLVALLCIFRN